VATELAKSGITGDDLAAVVPVIVAWHEERERTHHLASEADEMKQALLAKNAGLDRAALDNVVGRLTAPRRPPAERAAAERTFDAWARAKQATLRAVFDAHTAELAVLGGLTGVLDTLHTDAAHARLQTAADALFAAWKRGERSLPASTDEVFYARVDDAVIVGSSTMGRDMWRRVDANGVQPAPPSRCDEKARATVPRADTLATLDGKKGRLGARVVPAYAAGSVIGFKLFSIEPGGIFDVAGFCEGDVVTSAGEVALTSPAAAADALAKHRDAATVTLQGRRRGKPFTLVIEPR
jgi:hypothetical protein